MYRKNPTVTLSSIIAAPSVAPEILDRYFLVILLDIPMIFIKIAINAVSYPAKKMVYPCTSTLEYC